MDRTEAEEAITKMSELSVNFADAEENVASAVMLGAVFIGNLLFDIGEHLGVISERLRDIDQDLDRKEM